MIKKRLIQFSYLLFAGLVLIGKTTYAAGDVKLPQVLKWPDPESLMKWIETELPNMLINAAGIVFAVVLLIGGYQLLISAGNEESVTKGKNNLTWGIVGLIVVVLAKALSSLILKVLGG